MSKNTGINFEKLTQSLYQQLVDYDMGEYQKIEVKQNVKIKGKSGVEHQIDVYWEYKLAGVLYKTIIEVKDWKSKVKKEHIMGFYSKLDDIPGCPSGIFVSKTGFQSGAISYAKVHGIKLVVINETDTINHIEIKYQINSPHVENFTVIMDKEWLEKEFGDESVAQTVSLNRFVGDAVLVDDIGNTMPLLHYLNLAQKPYLNTLESKEKKRIKYLFDKKQYLLVEDPRINKVLVKGFEFDFFIIKHNDTIEIHPEGLADFVLKDLLDGTQIEFNEKHGIIKSTDIKGEESN